MRAYQLAMKKMVGGADLDDAEAEAVMAEMMDGALEPPQIGAFLGALATKGETADELTGLARTMRARAVKVPVAGPMLDTCGTGGSGLPTTNTSTMCAFVVAAGGVRVAKHGNRSSTGRCGSADVLDHLGVKIDLGPKQVARLIEEQGIAFMLAPLYHPAMRHAGPVRRVLGFRTAFNFLGPLANPAGVQRQLLGVSDKKRAPLLADALLRLGAERALLVHGFDGLDELTLSGATHAWEVVDGEVIERTLTPADAGLEPVPASAIAEGGDVHRNGGLFTDVLQGRETGGLRDLVALNAGAAFWVAGAVDDLAAGVARARELLADGKAWSTFEAYRDATVAVAHA